MINGQILYNLGGPKGKMGHSWNMGVNVDYEHHELKGTKAEVSVLSVLPFVEFGTRYDQWRPYSTFGVGMNFTAVKNEPSGVDVDAKNSLALRVGVGTDFYLTDHLALNVEAAWKLNNSDINSNVSTKGFAPGASGGGDASVVQTLFGIRYFWGE